MDTIHEWFVVHFDEHAIHLVVHPPEEAAWEQHIAWEQITRICFRTGRWPASGDLFLSTSEKPDGYLIPIDADGGKALWSAIRVRGLFSDAMADEAVGVLDELFCSPRRTRNDVIQTFPLYSPRQLPDLDGEGIALSWDQDGADSIVGYGDVTVWRERTGWEVYDRFEKIALILKHKYGSRLVDLVPTPNSRDALLGDSSAAAFHVASAREALGKDAPLEAFYWNQLQDAVRTGDTETIGRFLAQGGNPNMRRAPHDNNDTLLHMAARRRQGAIARMLIAACADPDCKDTTGVTPLHRAVRTRCTPAVRALLSNGADALRTNRRGSTPLHLAVQNTGRGGTGSAASREEQREIIRLLLSHGARPSDRDSSGRSVEDCVKAEWLQALLRQP